VKKLSAEIELIKQIKDQHKIELDYQLTATKEEANARIKAQEEIVLQIIRINRAHHRNQLSAGASIGGYVATGCSTYSNIMRAKIEGCQFVLLGVSCVVDQPPSIY
jgi:hypothetical protein